MLLRQLQLIRRASQKTRDIVTGVDSEGEISSEGLPVASEAIKTRWKQVIIDQRS